MKHIRKFVQKVAFAAIILMPMLALGAGEVRIPVGGQNSLPLENTDAVSTILERVANFMGSLIIAISVIVLMYAGFRFLTAGEDEEGVTEARKTIAWAVVGIIVALVAYSIPFLVGSITGAGPLQR